MADELILKTANKLYHCSGDGSRHINRAERCTDMIKPGDYYIERLLEDSPYPSGTRHCLNCAKEYFDFKK